MKKKKYTSFDLFFIIAKSIIAGPDNRLPLQYIYSDGENLIAASSRMMVFIPDPHTKGFYAPETVQKENKLVPVELDAAFPNWKQIVPRTPDAPILTFNAENPYIEEEIFLLQFAVAANCTEAILAQKSIDLLVRTGVAWECYISDRISPLVFKHDTVNVVVMPKRILNPKDNLIAKVLSKYTEKEFNAARKTPPDIAPPPVAAEPPPEPVEKPRPRTTRKRRKNACRYICTLANGEKTILYTLEDVRKRTDVTHCHIEPA